MTDFIATLPPISNRLANALKRAGVSNLDELKAYVDDAERVDETPIRGIVTQIQLATLAASIWPDFSGADFMSRLKAARAKRLRGGVPYETGTSIYFTASELRYLVQWDLPHKTVNAKLQDALLRV